MKRDQLIDYNKKNIFPQNYAKNETRTLVRDLFYFLKKLNMR